MGVTTRITMWATVGYLVTAGWAYYYDSISATPYQPTPIVDVLIRLTTPVVAIVTYFNLYPFSVWDVAHANAATYALLGIIVELTRRYYRRRKASN